MPDSAAFAAQLAALRERYAKQLHSTLDELNALIEGQGPDIARATLNLLHEHLHRLAGSGATFGFHELSRQARALELIVKTWLDVATPPSLVQWLEWIQGVRALRQTLVVQSDEMSAVTEDAGSVPRHHAAARVVLIEDDQALSQELMRGLSQFGYELTHYTGFAAAESAIRADPPDVMVVDIMLPSPMQADGATAIPPLFERLGYRIPTVYLTARTDFQARLSVARAGGDALLNKPVAIPTLAGAIETLLRVRDQAPYRVLIIDDDEVLAEHYRLVLIAAGMRAEKICQPERVLAMLEGLCPDLILMDLHMPTCTGAELARVIRYCETWQSVPIVYLSAEADLEQQISALGSGADDFLTKPISDVYLLAAVRARAARARKVAELMSQDSLTGLLKHASIKEQLVREVDRAQRHNMPLALVMLDIDHFKRVNDQWGHPMGDQIIKTLGHLLRQRLRRQDSIGRYGGEEFAAVLPECTVTDALHLIDDIRQRLSEIRFDYQGQAFNVTFSAGIASNDVCSGASDLLAAADAALYAAKRAGRNQVRVFTEVSAP